MSIKPFASVSDYRARYPNDSAENSVIEAVLLEATDVICAAMDDGGIDYRDSSESLTYRLMRICRTVAHRALGSNESDDSDVPFGATQLSETSAQFSSSVSFGNPYGDVFLTQAEKESLGIGVAKACVLSPYGGGKKCFSNAWAKR